MSTTKPKQSRESSIIGKVSYQESTGTLSITFTTGETYIYESIPNSVYVAFLNAPSLGMYFHKHIRGRYIGIKQTRKEGKR